MPITEDNRIIYEYKCNKCKSEIENDENRRLPWDCPECDEGRMFHVGPVLDECDKCHANLLYHGNRVKAFGLDSVCDNCYDRISHAI